MEQKTERLNKFLALQLGISRRQADELIEKGRISINGKTAQLGERFKEGDEIKLGEKIISKTIAFYICLCYNCIVNFCIVEQNKSDATQLVT